ncbi:MAG TPA: nuclear transport factor 2 family protein [Cyclobacteriaceae bacterium]|nr:nuclear transport factor 2 family protein [Cyclobacteriaceae bacterium]
MKFEAMNSHNLDALGNLYSDSARIQSLGFEPTEIGPAGIKGVYTRYFASTPDLKFEISRITTSDESVFIEYTSSGTMQQSPLEAVIPAYMIGKPYTLKNCTRIDVRDGKIVAEMTYFDQLAFLRQMGFFEQK